MEPTIENAVNLLLSVCDGAQNKDATGFNKFDSALIRGYMQNAPIYMWGDPVLYAAWKLLAKYTEQLERLGVIYNQIPVPKYRPATIPQRVIDFNTANNHFTVAFPYDKSLVSAIKQAPSRTFDGTDIVWVLPVTAPNIQFLQKFSEDYKFEWSSAATNATHSADRREEMPEKYITISNSNFVVFFPFDNKLVLEIKKCKSAYWDQKNRCWSLQAVSSVVTFLQEFSKHFGFKWSAAAEELVKEILKQQKENIALSEAKEATEKFELRPGLGGTLYPFQVAGVEYATNKKRTFISDEIGTGKSCEALATVWQLDAFPVLIVCPASLKLNWEREAGKWLPTKTVSVVNGKDNCFDADIVIINYDILAKRFPVEKDPTNPKKLRLTEPIPIKPQALICDESHFCKGFSTNRTQMVKLISRFAKIVLCLTGTPVLNRPNELITQLDIMRRLDDLGGFWRFATTFCNARRTRYGWDFSGASNLTALNDLLRTHCYVRRKKSEVLPELPLVQNSAIPVEITNRREYRKAQNDFVHFLEKKIEEDTKFQAAIKDLSEEEQKRKKKDRMDAAGNAEQLVKIEYLKQLSAKGKLESAYEWIDSFLETEEKLVVFAHHKEIVEAIAAKYNAVAITGGTPIEQRQKAIDAFQTDPACRIIVLNIRAGGVGITLTAASNVLFLEQDWTPSAMDQAAGRCSRIGQIADSVTAWHMLGQDTIDEDIYDLIERKRAVVNATTEGEEAAKEGILKQLTAKLLSGRQS